MGIQKVLRDMSVDRSVRRQRAEALLKLGQLLQEPYLERKKRSKGEGPSPSAPATSAVGSEETASNSTTATAASKSSKRSMIMRWKPRAPWSRSGSSRKEAKAEAQ